MLVRTELYTVYNIWLATKLGLLGFPLDLLYASQTQTFWYSLPLVIYMDNKDTVRTSNPAKTAAAAVLMAVILEEALGI